MRLDGTVFLFSSALSTSTPVGQCPTAGWTSNCRSRAWRLQLEAHRPAQVPAVRPSWPSRWGFVPGPDQQSSSGRLPVSHAESGHATALRRRGLVQREKRFVTGQTAGGAGTGPPWGRSGPSRIALGNSWKKGWEANPSKGRHALEFSRQTPRRGECAGRAG